MNIVTMHWKWALLIALAGVAMLWPVAGPASATSEPTAVISLGEQHTCALTTAGGVKCWGKNDDGQLGDNSKTQRNTPVDVSGLTSGVQAVSAGLRHTCALTTVGGVKCWGRNVEGQLGHGHRTPSTPPRWT